VPPISFWTPCKAPPGPPQTKSSARAHNSTNGKFLGDHYDLTLIFRDVAFPASRVGFGPPIDPPIDCPRVRSYWTHVRSSTENESLRAESKIVLRIGYNATLLADAAHCALDERAPPSCPARLFLEQRERAARESGPVRSSSESGVQCLPLRCQAHSRRVPCASPSDLDIDRLKIPLDIGSPPLCC